MLENVLSEQLKDEWEVLIRKLSSVDIAAPSSSFIRSPDSAVRAFVLFAELEETRWAWNELLEQTRLGENADRLVTSKWTLKDLMAHISSWACEFRQEVEIAARGESFDYAIPFALSEVGPNEWNESEVEKRRVRTLDSISKEFEKETSRLEDLILDLPEERIEVEMVFPLAPTGDASSLWRGSIANVIRMKCMHERWHMDRIRQWQKGLDIREGFKRRPFPGM